MKKTLVAIAALAAATGAMAQSAVSLYGSFDLGVQSADYKNIAGAVTNAAQRTISGINQGISGNGALTSNRIGFRGTEDLGGGMSAGFNYEMGFSGNNVENDSKTSAATLNGATARESNLTLSGKFGSAKLGYGTTLAHATVAGYSAIAGSNMVGDVAYASDSASSADYRIHTNMVRSNALTYTTPSFSGFTAAVSSGNQSDKVQSNGATDEGARNTALQLNFAQGPFKVSAVTATAIGDVKAVAADAAKYIVAVTASETETKLNAVAAQYTLGDIAFNVLTGSNTVTNKITGAQTSKNEVTQVGVKYAMGNSTLAAQYGTGKMQGANASTATGDRSGYQLAAIYNLSKRTNAYVAYGSQDIKYTDAALATNGVKEKATQTAVGLRHAF